MEIDTFDYIIVGGGTAGTSSAHSLSKLQLSDKQEQGVFLPVASPLLLPRRVSSSLKQGKSTMRE